MTRPARADASGDPAAVSRPTELSRASFSSGGSAVALDLPVFAAVPSSEPPPAALNNIRIPTPPAHERTPPIIPSITYWELMFRGTAKSGRTARRTSPASSLPVFTNCTPIALGRSIQSYTPPLAKITNAARMRAELTQPRDGPQPQQDPHVTRARSTKEHAPLPTAPRFRCCRRSAAARADPGPAPFRDPAVLILKRRLRRVALGQTERVRAACRPSDFFPGFFPFLVRDCTA